jgi:hypothetical protein
MRTMGFWKRALRSMAAVALLVTNVGLVELAGVQPAHAATVTEAIVSEDFDGVARPALPAGWTATRATGQGNDQTWQTSTPGLITDPNSVSVGANGHVTDMILESPTFQAGASPRVSFFMRYNLQATTGQFSGDALDGGVLEIKIGTAAYVDFLAAGGSFNAGEGYTRKIATTQSNPLGGRNAWSGISAGANHNGTLPSSASGQSVRLRWRFATSKHTANQGGTNFFQAQALEMDHVRVFSDKTTQTISFTSVAPFHPQAFTTYTPTATSSSGLPVTFSIEPGSVCSLAAGVVTFETPGICTIQADQAGNATFAAAPRATQGTFAVKADQTVFFTSPAPENPPVGTTYTPTAGASSGGPITFSIAADSSSVCSIGDANLVTFNAAGSCVIQADQVGNSNLNPARLTQNVNVVAAPAANQTISFTSNAPSNPAVGATYTPTATATSGLPVTFSIASGSSSICSIGGANLVTFNATGSCVIQADQSGNGSFNAAPRVTQSATVVAAAPANQTISFTSTAPVTPPVGATYTPTATATSGLPVSFSIAGSSSAVCSIGGANLVTFNATGSCVIQADQAGNGSFNAAPQVTQSPTVVKANQTISFTSTAPVNPPVGATYTPTATATSGLPAAFSIAGASSAVCSLGAANLVTFSATGSCVIQADQAGNGSFNAAPQVTQSATVVAPAVSKAWITGFTASSLRNDFGGWVGSRLVVGPANVSVSALGRWVVAGNTSTHAVRLVNSTGTDVATATVDTAVASAGAFKYAPLGSPVTLTAGATYYLLSQESVGGDSWYEYDLSTTTTAVASDTGAAWAASGTPGSVVAGGSAGQSYGPSNFLYASTAPPAPVGTALVTSFTAGTARNDFAGWVGMRLAVGSSNLSVSALGRWAVGNDTGTHTVRLVNAATGADVASVAVDVNGAPAGSYVYASLAAPVTLSANTTYYLVSQETMGGDRWYNYDTNTFTTSAGADIGVVYATSDSPNSFVVGGGPGQAYGPPSLLYTP